MSYYDIDDITAYIQRQAAARRIDPRVALKVARAEGLGRGTWQSNIMKGGRREPSYGPFQMLEGGGKTGFPVGMGNAFEAATGLEVSDPKNVKATIDYALNHAAKEGWGQWYGAKNAGISNMAGIGADAKGITLDNIPAASRIHPEIAPSPADPGSIAAAPNDLGLTFGAGLGEGAAAGIGTLPTMGGMNPIMSMMGGLGKMMGGMGRGKGGGGSTIMPSGGLQDDPGRHAAGAALMQQLLMKKLQERNLGMTLGV